MKIFVVIFLHLPFIWTTPEEPDQARIVGGVEALAGQFPYAAAIRVKTPDSSFFCEGALISNQFIITAGHCVENATQFDITVGSNHLSADDSNRISLTAAEYTLHPDYNGRTLENDIGLIKLRATVQFSAYIDRIHLPVTEYGAGVNVTAIGWGQTNDSQPGPVEYLNCVHQVTISNEECMLFYGNQITDTMICVSGQYNEGICIGDSGGPLVYLLNNKHPIVVGVASFYSNRGCESLDPSGYARTFPYRDWILNITGSLGD